MRDRVSNADGTADRARERTHMVGTHLNRRRGW